MKEWQSLAIITLSNPLYLHLTFSVSQLVNSKPILGHLIFVIIS